MVPGDWETKAVNRNDQESFGTYQPRNSGVSTGLNPAVRRSVFCSVCWERLWRERNAVAQKKLEQIFFAGAAKFSVTVKFSVGIDVATVAPVYAKKP